MFEERAPETAHPEQDHILAALPLAERERSWSHATLTRLPLDRIPYEADDALSHIDFPTDSVVSLTRLLADGTTAGTSMPENGGGIGRARFMGGETPTGRALVHSAGHAFRLYAAPGNQECVHHGRTERGLRSSSVSRTAVLSPAIPLTRPIPLRHTVHPAGPHCSFSRSAPRKHYRGERQASAAWSHRVRAREDHPS